MMKKSLLALAALVAAAAPGLSCAEDAPAAAAPAAAPAASPLTYNVGLVTDYRYRGISQSRLNPALQGGIDYAFESGAYIGTWASMINWIKDGGTIAGVDAGSTPLEWDLYGGYKGELVKDVTYDVGGLAYVYVGNKYGNIPGSANANTFELYGALTYGVGTLKYSHALTNVFGFGDSKNSGYLDLSAALDLGDGWSLTPHVGRQVVKGPASIASYTDYSLTVGKDLGSGFSATLGVVGTNADETVYVTPAGKFTGKSSLVAGLKYAF